MIDSDCEDYENGHNGHDQSTQTMMINIGNVHGAHVDDNDAVSLCGVGGLVENYIVSWVTRNLCI